MAGSYNHAVDKTTGKLLNNQQCVSMAAENGGDAYETIEEMYGMIWWLAQVFPDPANAVEEARLHYRDGLAASPGTDGELDEEDV
jgi:hypothetical protein